MAKITTACAGLALALAGTFVAAAPAASATTRHTVTGTEHFTITSTSAAENAPDTIVAVGPVSGTGTLMTRNDNEDNAILPGGTIILVHHRTRDHASFDPTTCVFTYEEWGTWRFGVGTGALRGATGHGTYQLHIHAKSYSENQPPTAFSLVVEAVGTATA